MPEPPQMLRIEFASQEHFLEEYALNISNGGIFVATEDHFEVHDEVGVQVALTYCQKRISLVGEVVHRVSPELATNGAEPGVAVQLSVPVGTIRASFQPFVGDAQPSESATGGGRRNASRTLARLRARVRIAGERSAEDLEVHTRNLSSAGVLVSIGSEPIAVGQAVSLVLTHPNGDRELDIDGTVVRHLEASNGRVAACGIAFHVAAHNRASVSTFVEEVRTLEHSRGLGLITGPIEDVGLERLIASFAACSPRGTLTVFSEVEEGMISFHDGALQIASLGGATGAKALARMLAWDEGRFEFRAEIDRSAVSGAAMPLEEAIAQARDFVDRDTGIELLRRAPNARLCLAPEAFQGDPPENKTERAILDLAAVGMTVGKVVDVIPDSDAVVCAVLRGLVQRGAVTIEE